MSRASERIFVVEDKALIAMEIRHRLERLGYVVCGEARRGEDALEQVPELRPDLILMDIRLAGALDGAETARRLRAHCAAPVVFLTTYEDDASLRQAEQAEPLGFLVKPFDERELHATIRMALYKSQMETRLREAYRQLEDSAEFVQSILDAIPTEVGVLDETGRIVTVNRAWQQFGWENGMPREFTMEGVNYLEVCETATGEGAEDAAVVAAGIREVLAGRRPSFAYEYRCDARRASDTPCWFLVRVNRYKSATGHHIVITHDDVSQVRHALAKASNTERTFASLAEVSPVGIYLSDAAGRIVSVNQQGAKIVGQPERACLGHGWRRTVDPADIDRVKACWLTAVRERRQFYSEFRFARPDNSWVWVIGQAKEITGPDGEVTGYIGTLTDITDRKRAEEALQRNNYELEARVRQRTLELEAAKESAERANHAKSEFLSRMSHELRTPLNAILGFGQLLSERLRTGDNADDAREIVRAGRHLLSLINEVLDLASIEAGRMSVKLDPVALEQVVDECLRLVRPLAEQQGVELLAPVGNRRACVRADTGRLQQVLLNLLSNAVKYNRAGGRVMIHWEEESGTTTVYVSDTGPGIEMRDIDRLFQPFERLEAYQRGVEGSGIGLALSKRLIELMGGQIGVESRPGAGCVFWLKLQTSTDARSFAPESDESGDLRRVAHPVTDRKIEILCIEDNAANMRLVERVLAHRPGLCLLAASDAASGLALARKHRPALILLDINLPGRDGYDVLAELRAEDSTRDIPTIAISANAMPRDLARGAEAGFDAYLTKPLNVKALLEKVDEILRSTSSQDGA